MDTSLDLPPFPSEGVNVHCLTLANHCHLKGVPQSEAVEIIRRMGSNLRQGRKLKPEEVRRAVEKSYSSPLPDKLDWKAGPRKPKWPEFDQRRASGIIARRRATIADLVGASPVDLSKFVRGRAGVADYIVWNLFPGAPWLCIGSSAYSFETVRKRDLFFAPTTRRQPAYDLHSLPLIVPSPMRAKYGKTQGGKDSQHTLDATGPRRFIVVEFDKIGLDEQPSLIVELAQYLPLVLVVYSGNRSLHSWFFVEDMEEAVIQRWFRFAVALGADRQLWTRSQFVRMPGGTRHKPGDHTHGAFQTPFYFNPAVMGVGV